MQQLNLDYWTTTPRNVEAEVEHEIDRAAREAERRQREIDEARRVEYAAKCAQWEREHWARLERWDDEAADRRRRKAEAMPAAVRSRRFGQAGGRPW